MAALALTAEQEAQLEACCAKEGTAITDGQWHAACAELLAFVARHRRLPRRRETAAGLWASNQRQSYHAGALRPDRALVLEAVPLWTWNARHAHWPAAYAAVQAFVAAHRRLPQNAETSPEGMLIGKWVCTQRLERNAGRLPPDRAEALEAIPLWTWKPHEAAWQAAYEALCAFVSEHGRQPKYCGLRGPEPGEARVRAWAHRQRAARRSGALSRERAAALEAIPGWLWQIAPA